MITVRSESHREHEGEGEHADVSAACAGVREKARRRRETRERRRSGRRPGKEERAVTLPISMVLCFRLFSLVSASVSVDRLAGGRESRREGREQV